LKIKAPTTFAIARSFGTLGDAETVQALKRFKMLVAQFVRDLSTARRTRLLSFHGQFGQIG